MYPIQFLYCMGVPNKKVTSANVWKIVLAIVHTYIHTYLSNCCWKNRRHVQSGHNIFKEHGSSHVDFQKLSTWVCMNVSISVSQRRKSCMHSLISIIEISWRTNFLKSYHTHAHTYTHMCLWLDLQYCTGVS